jgi:diguanylate cyclase (GGDEF)-like protein
VATEQKLAVTISFCVDVMAELNVSYQGKSKAELIKELENLHKRIAQLEAIEVELEKSNKILEKRKTQLADSQRVAKLGSWDLNLVTNELEWSEETYQLFDKVKEEFVPSFDEFACLVHPEDLDYMQSNFDKALESDDYPYHVTVRVINNSGHSWVMEAYAVVSRDKNNRPLSIFGTAQDVTERVKIEEELRRHRNHLEEMVAQRTLELSKEVAEREKAGVALQEANEKLRKQITEITTLQAALHEQAIRDPLTGLFNRRHMNERLLQEVARSKRNGNSFSIIILDIDNLKEINDCYGHASGGDQILQVFADELLRVSRAEDTICRYGGDEFLIILYETPFQAAYERALEWRDVVKKIKLEHSNGDLSITFSAGVAEFPLHGNTSDEVIIQADKALYRAKKLGRDQVVKAF